MRAWSNLGKTAVARSIVFFVGSTYQGACVAHWSRCSSGESRYQRDNVPQLPVFRSSDRKRSSIVRPPACLRASRNPGSNSIMCPSESMTGCASRARTAADLDVYRGAMSLSLSCRVRNEQHATWNLIMDVRPEEGLHHVQQRRELTGF